MDNFEEDLEQTIKDILNKQSIDTFELFKKDTLIFAYLNVKAPNLEGKKANMKLLKKLEEN